MKGRIKQDYCHGFFDAIRDAENDGLKEEGAITGLVIRKIKGMDTGWKSLSNKERHVRL